MLVKWLRDLWELKTENAKVKELEKWVREGLGEAGYEDGLVRLYGKELLRKLREIEKKCVVCHKEGKGYLMNKCGHFIHKNCYYCDKPSISQVYS